MIMKKKRWLVRKNDIARLFEDEKRQTNLENVERELNLGKIKDEEINSLYKKIQKNFRTGPTAKGNS